jgi:hypothetical protein
MPLNRWILCRVRSKLRDLDAQQKESAGKGRRYLAGCAIAFLFFALPLCGEERTRISTLMPDLPYPLAVEPALPPDYSMAAFESPPDLFEGVFWGSKEELQEFLKDPGHISAPLISVSLSPRVRQLSAHRFTGEANLSKDLKKKGFKQIQIERFAWGPYPVLSLNALNAQGREVLMAWVGLNAPDGDWVLLLRFLYPLEQERPSATERAIWSTLLTRTAPLPELSFLRAYGIEMHEDGSTLYSYGSTQLRAVAQKRRRDNKLLVLVQPLTKNATFKMEHVYETLLGTAWNHGKPCVKIDGLLTQTSGETLSLTTTVLLQEVDEFLPLKEKSASSP